MSLGLIQNLLKNEQIHPTRALSLKAGQIFQGKAIKLFREDIAQIKVGAIHFVAKLQAPLTLYQNYWFQVQPNDNQTELKVINKAMGKSNGTLGNEQVGEHQLINKVGLKITKSVLQLITLLHKENIPFSAEQLKQANNHLISEKEITKGLNAVKYLIANHLPITSDTYHSLKAIQNDIPIARHISNMLADLLVVQNKTSNTVKLIDMLQQIMGQDLIKVIEAHGSKEILPNQSTMQKAFQQIITSLGLQHENELVSSMENGNRPSLSNYESLKPLLLTALSELSDLPSKETLEHLTHRITGTQLLSLNKGDIGHLIFQLPLNFGDKLSDLTIQFYGKKHKSLKIDPNYCQLFFHLELKTLNETLIDVKVQNRILSITVYNDNPLLGRMIDGMKISLSEGLEKVDYKLSTIKVNRLSEISRGIEPKHPSSLVMRGNDGFSGVDIKI